MCQRRFSLEKEMHKDTLDYQEIWDLLEKVGLIKIVTDIDPCYEKLVSEFIVNMYSECNKEGRKVLCKVYVQGCCVKFSLEVINDYLGRKKYAEYDSVPSQDKVARKISANQVQQWPKKSSISSSLSVKYVVLNRICASNRVPTNHSSSITSVLAKLIFRIRTKAKLILGNIFLARQ